MVSKPLVFTFGKIWSIPDIIASLVAGLEYTIRNDGLTHIFPIFISSFPYINYLLKLSKSINHVTSGNEFISTVSQ